MLRARQNRKTAFGPAVVFSRRPVSGVFSRFTAQAPSHNADRHKKLGDNAVFKKSGAGHNEIAIRYRRLLFWLRANRGTRTKRPVKSTLEVALFDGKRT